MSCALSRGPMTVLAVSMTIGGAVHAQTVACDDFKATLAARFDSSGVRGYSLEAVPASAPTPSDAKVIGNCESGAYKILYRRWGAAQAATPAAMSPAQAGSPRAPARQASSASTASSARAPGALAASTAVLPPAPVPAASGPPVARPVETVAALPPSAARGDDAPGTWQRLAARGIDFATAHWPWIGVLLVLPLAGWIWRAYLSPYDRQGLPRGPRL